MLFNLHWLIGRAGVGKTTYGKKLANAIPDSLLVQTGVACREKFGAAMMSETQNPLAPQETEVFVRQLVCQSVGKLNNRMCELIIDAMPRSPAQVRWIYEEFMCNPSFINTFHYVICDERERMDRIVKRDSGDADDFHLMDVRNQMEAGAILRVLEEVHLAMRIGPNNCELKVVDTTKDTKVHVFPHMRLDSVDIPEIESVRSDYSLQAMLSANDQFSDRTLADLKITMMDLYEKARHVDSTVIMSDTALWTRRFIERAKDELVELLENIPVEWWSKDEVDLRKCRVELIDAWHFILSAMRALGMDAEFFARTYFAKRAVNMTRQQNGYLKRTKVKGDDEHVGKAD
jgi:adenylate kinase family enzyme